MKQKSVSYVVGKKCKLSAEIYILDACLAGIEGSSVDATIGAS